MPEEKFGTNPKITEDYGVELEILVVRSKTFDKQYQKSAYKSEIKRLIKDIRAGYIYNDGNFGGDTHYLSDFSHKDSHVLSKKINDIDRLNYRIYRPRLVKKPNGNWDYFMKVVLESCEGHTLNGTPDYVDDKKYAQMKRNKNKR